MKNNRKSKAFTLAEIMIVMTVIGILAAILLPVLKNALPDDKVAKFQKGNSTFLNSISTLVNNDTFYSNGDLGRMFNGKMVSSSSYFCLTLINVMVYKEANCKDNQKPIASQESFVVTLDMHASSIPKASQLDNLCLKTQTVQPDIVTKDGIEYWDFNPGVTFASKLTDNRRIFGEAYVADDYKIDDAYKIVCMDIDGRGKGEAPFGYGVRADGRVILSPRANTWSNKDIRSAD